MNTDSFVIDPTKTGHALYLNGQIVLTIEPLGTPEEPPIGEEPGGQHYIATPHTGPDAGRVLRIPPVPKTTLAEVDARIVTPTVGRYA